MRRFFLVLLSCIPFFASGQLQFEETTRLLLKTWEPAILTALSGEKIECEIQFDMVTRPEIIEVQKDGNRFLIPIKDLKELSFDDSFLGKERSFIIADDGKGAVRFMEFDFRTSHCAVLIGREIKTYVSSDPYGSGESRNSSVIEKKYLLNTTTLEVLPLSLANLYRLFETKKKDIRAFVKEEKIYFLEEKGYKKLLRHIDTLM